MFSRRSSGLFRKYFLVTISIILASFVFIGGALLLLVSKLWMDEKINLLTENSISVAQNTSDVLESDYLGESGRGSVIVICNTLMQISNAIEADCFITNINGDVVYCKEILQSNMALYTGNCMVHNQYKIPKEIMNSAVKGLYRSTGDLGGSLNSIHFVVAAPVVVNDEAVAVVFATQPVVDGLTPYVAAIFKMFFIAALFALALTFVLVYLVSYRLTKPLREMSAAAKQYATGDFSKRINIKRSKFRISGHDEIDELVQAFNTMAQALATLEMSRRSFVANVSHELKTPMTTIGGFIDGMLDGTIPPERHEEYLQIVSNEIKRLSRLVTSMLNLSKIEAGELEPKYSDFDISSVIIDCMLNFEQAIEKNNITVEGFENIRTVMVHADRDMIHQVIYNLVDNAVKFTPENGTISVFAGENDSNQVYVSIQNTGDGISPEEIGRVFERFYKVDKSRSYDVKSAGLGLYLCKTIVEMHGGKIFAESIEGQFTRFTVLLEKKKQEKPKK